MSLPAEFGRFDRMKDKKQEKKAALAQPQSLLRDLARTPDKLFGGAFRLQFGALCFRYRDDGEIDVLVITSRDSGRWVIPKGWPMKGKKPHEPPRSKPGKRRACAARRKRSRSAAIPI